MSEHANGTCIVKYKKVKSVNHGSKRCIDYVINPEKTMEGQLEMDRNIEFELEYISNEDKVAMANSGRKLVTGWNCEIENAAKEFELLEKKYHKNKTEKLNEGHKANQAFHIIISYKGVDISPEEVHEMGNEFVKRLCADEFMAITATHLNTDNYHNHIIMCAYGLDGKHKFLDSKNIYKQFKEIAYDISLEHGLPIMSEEDIKEKVSRKEKARRERVTKEVTELRKQYPDYTKYKPVHISAYDEFGRHRGNFERMLLTCKEMMRQGSEAAYKDALRDLDGDNIFFMPISERAKLTEQATELCRKYDIGDMQDLEEALRQAHAENSPYKQKIKALETFISNVEKYGIKARFKTDAELNPMQPKTKSDMYKALNDSEYRLTVPYSKISDDKAKEIIRLIRQKEKDNLLDELTLKGIFKEPPACNSIERSEEEFAQILAQKKQKLIEIKEEQNPIISRISELYSLKINIEKYLRPEFVFGPLHVGDESILDRSLSEIRRENNKKEKRTELIIGSAKAEKN